jgi:replicative DNA helicase
MISTRAQEGARVRSPAGDRHQLGHRTVPQYLGKLAANAATIINAKDYAQVVGDLAIRRNLILIGEDMVNAAYDSPVDFPPKEQIEEAEARLYRLTSDAMGGELTWPGSRSTRSRQAGGTPSNWWNQEQKRTRNPRGRCVLIGSDAN